MPMATCSCPFPASACRSNVACRCVVTASGEPFLVFRNADSDGLSVLLRRRNGDFGLIEAGR